MAGRVAVDGRGDTKRPGAAAVEIPVAVGYAGAHAYGPQHGVVAVQLVLECLLLVIDHLIGPQLAHQLDVTGADGGAHLGPQQLGKLDSKGADATGSGRDKHLLASLQIGALLQRLP